MKKKLLLMLIVTIVLCMSACSTGKTGETESDTQTDPVIDTKQESQTDEQTEKETDVQTEEETKYVPERKIKIACVGDSLTYGVGATSAAVSSYPAQLQNVLGTEHYEVKNFGRSSSYMIDPRDYPDFKFASDRSVAYKSTVEYQNSLKYDADIVIICLGANDAYVSNTNTGVDQARYFLESAIALAREYQNLPSSPEVLFMYPPSRHDAQYRYDYLKNTVIPKIGEAAQAVGSDVVDLFTITDIYAKNKNTVFITSDGIHYTARGYTEIAKAVYSWVADFRLG